MPGAMVLTELIIVIIIISAMTAIAIFNFSGVLSRTKFKRQAHGLINVLNLAQNAAAETDRRYAVILDFDENTYTLRQFAVIDHDKILDEEPIIAQGYFTDQCRLDYVLFDDFVDTRDWDIENMEFFRAWFFAGHSGWQYGGKIVLLDADGNPYSVVINRLSKVIALQPGDVEILEPRYKEDVPF